MANYFDNNGNYINVENLSLAEIYHRAFALGVESTPIRDERCHGNWLNAFPIDDSAECSVCGEYGYLQNNYCPNCGAMMDEGDS